ncbi:OsmC family protein [Arthrobacter rhizosphaerae]|uniref:OsmC family protein n=1 Tax=Arthrobacter rhizosphaerae TaxID=2855490 RepID=UPI001FF2BD31|nr:OsmC family protein [Arthrobacter rhizosphaerae]
MDQSRISEAISSAKDYLISHPDEARYRDSMATAVVEDGLRVRVEGPHGASLATDMVAGVGGTASAPSPGWLFRAANASCTATLIAMRAAARGVNLSRLEVSVDSESDDRGLLGVDDGVPPGPLGVRVSIRAASDNADDDTVREIVMWSLEHSPIEDAVVRPIPVEHDIQIG